MVNVQVRTIQSGAKGQVAKLKAEVAIQLFFRFGVKRIQDECNRIAARYRASWSQKAPYQYMIDYGLQSTTYDDGLKELEMPYELFEPDEIWLDILDSYHHKNMRTPATQQFVRDTKVSLITIYLGPLSFDGINLSWTGFDTSYECVIYHELVHACGDSPEFRNIKDGVIRHTRVACEAIANLKAVGI